MRLTALKSHCKFYQQLLGLEEWEFKISFTPKLSGSDVGQVLFDSKKKSGHIKILSKSRLDRDDDQEQILVHELLHCRFSRVHLPNSPSYEEAIDNTATCIVNLRRQLQG